MQPILTEENYQTGVLMDEDVLGGVAQTENGTFAAYVVRYATAETIAFEEFNDLSGALAYLATIDRQWVFRKVGCGGGCGGEGGCGGHGHDGAEGHGCGGHGHDGADDDSGCCGGCH